MNENTECHWPPHVTVATVVERDGLYLLVEERDKFTGELVFNQPAGHLDPGESLAEAALRETREETRWEVRLTGVLGMALYPAQNGVLYYRTTFLAEPLAEDSTARLDPDIHAIHWLSYEAILANSARMRSPLVLAAIEQHRKGLCAPMDLIYA
ncbi:NUDIX domain-containing protein [Haliea sp. E17]|uniref:NUDIX domain-containing protein n=1 Tax=Haliea sp. E17 TaxID=3401576 RepID=UPI003AAC16E8